MQRISKNDLFMNAFNFSAIGMAIVSTTGRWLNVNPALCRILGYSASELEQIIFQDITHSDDLELYLDNLNKMLNGETQYFKMENRYIKKNGDIIWGELSVSLVKDENNNSLYFISQLQDISEQKVLKEELEKSKERYRNWIEYSPEPMVIHYEGKIIYVNEVGVKTIGAKSYKDLRGEKIADFIHPDDKEMVFQRIQQMLITNQRLEPYDIKLMDVNGKEMDVRLSSVPINYQGKKAIQVFFSNITQRKKIERELNQSQEQYRSVIENVKEVIFHTDIQGIWTFLNPAWEEITGYTIEESIGKPFHDYVYQEDCEQNDEQFQSLMQGKQKYYLKEVRYLTKEGGYRWIEVFSRVTLNDQGEIIGTLGTLNDITKRKKSEEELKVSEERFRLLAEYSSDMITMHNVKGKYLYVSPACKEILQYDEEEIVGQDAYLFIHPDDQEMVKEHHQTLVNTGYTVSTYRIRRKSGEYVWFESAIKLLNEIHSGEQKQIVVSRNISERKLVEQKLQEANELLRHLSTIDGLTGVSNRRAFDERLEIEWNRSCRNSTSLSLIMLDIDYFKAYNDTYGHQGGDGCLKQIASVIQDTLGRSTDLLCRYGGEEFCVILPETDEVEAKTVGEKIRNAIEKSKIPHAGSKILPWVTISVGIAIMIPTMYTSYTDLISNADKAVYQAKNNGRNCVRSYE